MKYLAVLAATAGLAFAQSANKGTVSNDPPLVNQADKMRADLMQAQRDYQIARAPFEQQIATLPQTKALQAQIQKFNEFCTAQGKDPNYDTGLCQSKEKAPEGKPKQ